jgi:hypothetical protein
VWSRATSDKPLVELFPPKGYMADSSKFDLKVNLPENEKLLAVILLYRPAKNRYVCVVSDDRMTSETSYSNLTELSTALLNLKKRYSPDA